MQKAYIEEIIDNLKQEGLNVRGRDLTGEKFGKLTVLGKARQERIAEDLLGDSLAWDGNRSCGCLKRE